MFRSRGTISRMTSALGVLFLNLPGTVMAANPCLAEQGASVDAAEGCKNADPLARARCLFESGDYPRAHDALALVPANQKAAVDKLRDAIDARMVQLEVHVAQQDNEKDLTVSIDSDVSTAHGLVSKDLGSRSYAIEVARPGRRAWTACLEPRSSDKDPYHRLIVKVPPLAPLPLQLRVESPKGASVKINDREAEEVTLVRGQNRIEVSQASETPWHIGIEQDPDDSNRVILSLTAVRPSASARTTNAGPHSGQSNATARGSGSGQSTLASATRRPKDWLVPASAAVAVTSLAVAATSGVLWRLADGQAQDSAETHNRLVQQGASSGAILAARDDASGARDRRGAFGIMSLSSLGAGVAFGAMAIVLAASHERGQQETVTSSRESSAARVQVSAFVTPSGYATAARFSF